MMDMLISFIVLITSQCVCIYIYIYQNSKLYTLNVHNFANYTSGKLESIKKEQIRATPTEAEASGIVSHTKGEAEGDAED